MHDEQNGVETVNESLIKEFLQEAKELRTAMNQTTTALATVMSDLRHGESHMERLDGACDKLTSRMDIIEDKFDARVKSVEEKVPTFLTEEKHDEKHGKNGEISRTVFGLWIGLVGFAVAALSVAVTVYAMQGG